MKASSKSENLKESTEEDEIENQQLRAHVLDDKQQDNELTGNQIEVNLLFFFV